MNKIVRNLTSHWVIILLGLFLVLAFEDISWFLFFLFLVFLHISTEYAEYHRKLMRVFHLTDEIKLLAIQRKLKISDDEISIVEESVKKDVFGEKRWKDFEKELKEISQ